MRNKKVILWIAIPICVIILALVVIASMLLYRGNIMVVKVNPSINTVNKALALQKTGGSLELKKEDLNGLLEFYLSKTFKSPSIEGVYSEIDNNELQFYVPASYKGLNFLLYTRGKLDYQDKKLVFNPSSFKVGKLSFSSKFIMEKLQKYLNNNNISIKDNSIILSSDLIPFDFTAFSVKDNVVVMDIAKAAEAPAQNAASGPNTPSATVVDQNKALLIKANSQLSGVYSEAVSFAEKQIVSSMRSVIGKMIDNPSYPYQADANQTKANYNKLSQGEKDDLKNAMMDNMDMQTVKKLRATFGF